MESFSNGNGPGCGGSCNNGPAGPYTLTVDDTPLNPVPDIWVGAAPPGSL